MPLPEDGTPEWKDLAEKFPTATHEWIVEKARQYGYKDFNVFGTVMNRRGVYRIRSKILPTESGLSNLEQHVLKIVKKEYNPSVGEISRQLDRSSETVIKIIDSLRSKSYEVILDELKHEVTIPEQPSTDFHPSEFNYFRKYYKIGVAGDTQIGSKYQQMTAWYDLYNIFEQRKVDFTIHPGDLFDGMGMYRNHRDELFLTDGDKQLKYAIDKAPKTKAFKTYLIGGQHDYCYYSQNGFNIIESFCKDRRDFVYKGFYQSRFKVKGLLIGVEHTGGGVAYARSYHMQKYQEALTGHMMSSIRTNPEAVKNLPVITIFGHWHVTMHLPNYMGSCLASMPCLQSQTKYLQQKRLMPEVGGAIIELWLNQDNSLSSVKIEFIIMNDRIKEKDY